MSGLVPDTEWAAKASDADLSDALLLWVGAVTGTKTIQGDGIFLAAEIVQRLRARPAPGAA